MPVRLDIRDLGKPTPTVAPPIIEDIPQAQRPLYNETRSLADLSAEYATNDAIGRYATFGRWAGIGEIVESEDQHKAIVGNRPIKYTPGLSLTEIETQRQNYDLSVAMERIRETADVSDEIAGYAAQFAVGAATDPLSYIGLGAGALGARALAALPLSARVAALARIPAWIRGSMAVRGAAGNLALTPLDAALVESQGQREYTWEDIALQGLGGAAIGGIGDLIALTGRRMARPRAKSAPAPHVEAVVLNAMDEGVPPNEMEQAVKAAFDDPTIEAFDAEDLPRPGQAGIGETRPDSEALSGPHDLQGIEETSAIPAFDATIGELPDVTIVGKRIAFKDDLTHAAVLAYSGDATARQKLYNSLIGQGIFPKRGIPAIDKWIDDIGNVLARELNSPVRPAGGEVSIGGQEFLAGLREHAARFREDVAPDEFRLVSPPDVKYETAIDRRMSTNGFVDRGGRILKAIMDDARRTPEERMRVQADDDLIQGDIRASLSLAADSKGDDRGAFLANASELIAGVADEDARVGLEKVRNLIERGKIKDGNGAEWAIRRVRDDKLMREWSTLGADMALKKGRDAARQVADDEALFQFYASLENPFGLISKREKNLGVSSLMDAIEGQETVTIKGLDRELRKLQVGGWKGWAKSLATMSLDDPDLQLRYVSAMHGIQAGKDPASQMASKIAAAVASRRQALAARLRDAGVWVEDDFDFWQSHDGLRISKDIAGWREFLIENLDTKAHWNPEATADDLLRTLDRIDLLDREERIFQIRREIHFKSPEAAVEYWKRYGNPSALDTTIRGLRRMAYMTSIAERFGPRPFSVADKLLREAVDRSPSGKETDRLFSVINGSLEDLIGSATNDAPNWFTGLTSIAKNYEIGQTLNKVALWSLPDQFTSWNFLSGAHKGNVKAAREFLDTYRDLLTGLNKEEVSELVGALGGAHSTIYGTVARRVSPIDMMGESARGPIMAKVEKHIARFAQASLRLQGAPALFEGTQMAATGTLSRALAKYVGRDLDSFAGDFTYQILRESGVTKGDWAKLSAEHIEGPYLDIRKIKDTPLRVKMQAFFAKSSREMVVTPDLTTKRILRGWAKKGAITGNLAELMLMFQASSLSHMRNVVGVTARRMAYNRWQGAASLAKLTGGMMMSGYLITQIKQVLKDEPFYEDDSPVFWTKVLDNSGMFYIFGSLGANITRQAKMRGEVDLRDEIGDGFFGPFVDRITEGAQTNIVAPAQHGITPKIKADMARYWASQIPFANIWWYSRWTTGRAMKAMSDEIDPAGRRKRRVRQRKEGVAQQ